MLPLEVGARPRSARPSVVLPDPDSPTTPSTSPRARVRFTPSTALTTRPLSPSSRDSGFPDSSKWTARSSSSSTVVDRSGSGVDAVSGFVGNGDLLALQGGLLRLVELEALGEVGGPASRPVAVAVVAVDG